MIMPKQTPPVELLMQRLFSILSSVPTNNANIPQWGLCSRRMRLFDQVPSEVLPAAFQFQSPVREADGYVRGIGKDMIGVNWMVYFPNSPDLATVVSPPLNDCFDALSNALTSARWDSNGNVIPSSLAAGVLPGQPQAQNLGFPGQVMCYKDGPGLTDEGLLQTHSLVHVPIKILIGM